MRQQHNHFFLVQILRDLFNLKDQIQKRNEFSIMTTPDQPKKNLMILVVKGKVKKSRNSLNKVFEKKQKYLFMCFCHSSGEYDLNSYILFKRGIHRLQHVGGQKMSNNKCPLFTMLTKQNSSMFCIVSL